MFKRAGLVATVCATVVLSATACSSDKHPATTTTTARTTSSTAALVVPTSVPNDIDVRKAAAMTKCEAAPGGWQASGTMTNTSDKDATYVITVFFTSTGATDLGFATTDVPVAAGKTAAWSAKATFSAPDKVLCVLRGVAAK